MRFKSTFNIFKDNGEVYDPNYFDTPFLQLPPKIDWDYSRELQIEDVDIWEVIIENGGGFGAYASWLPYAEFYMITLGNKPGTNDRIIETYYGKGAEKAVIKRLKQLNAPFSINKIWVDEDKLWLYS